MPLLDNDPDTTDLQAKVSHAWREFADAVAAALPDLPAAGRLEVVLDPTAGGTGDAHYSVAVTRAGDQLVARAVGNASLPADYHMNRAAVAAMVALGWSPPGVDPGSGGDFGMTAEATGSDEPARLAAVIARTLRDIYGAPHPAFLVYTIHGGDGGGDGGGGDGGGRDGGDGGGAALPLPPLGTARAVTAVPDPAAPAEPAPATPVETYDAEALREQVRTVVAVMQGTTPDQLIADADGDIGIRAGSAMVFVKVRQDPPLVDVFSPILTQITPSEKLYGRLSELTNRMPIGRLYCANETVWASVPVFGRNFQPSHLTLAVQVMTGLADELDDRLHGEFGGRRFFAEDDHPAHLGESASTGMYL
jgi:hypothetical protein